MFEQCHRLAFEGKESWKNMEAKTCISLEILVMMVLCNSMNPSRAMSMDQANSSFSIIGDDKELEFLMDSHSSRILQSGGTVSGNTGNAGQPAANCGRNNAYDSCLPNQNRPATPQNCGVYTRSCGRWKAIWSLFEINFSFGVYGPFCMNFIVSFEYVVS